MIKLLFQLQPNTKQCNNCCRKYKHRLLAHTQITEISSSKGKSFNLSSHIAEAILLSYLSFLALDRSPDGPPKLYPGKASGDTRLIACTKLSLTFFFLIFIIIVGPEY